MRRRTFAKRELATVRQMKNLRMIVVLIALVVVAILFAAYVWPTRYMYMRSSPVYDPEWGFVRIDRFSGEVECLCPRLPPSDGDNAASGWRKIKGGSPTRPEPSASPK